VLHLLWALVGLGGPRTTHLLLRASLALGAAATTAACAQAARRAEGQARRGWTLFALTGASWCASQLVTGVRELLSGSTLALPAPADVPSNMAIVLSMLALLAFLQGALSNAARLRILLDGLLIAASVLFVSWALVLEDLYRSSGDGRDRILGLTYPMGDVVLASLLLVAAGRVRPGARLSWRLLGSGLGLLAAGHVSFAYLQLAGIDPGPGTQSASWLAGTLLVGLAALASDPRSWALTAGPRAVGRLGIVLPYLPLLLAGAVTVGRRLDQGAPAFLALNGGVILVLLLTRQLMAQLENLELTHELEAKVRRRTAELHRQERRFRSIAQNASEILTVVDANGVISWQSESAERVLGYHPDDLLGRRLEDLLVPEEARWIVGQVRAAPPSPAPPTVLATRLRRADGSMLQAEITVSNLLADPAVEGFLLTSRDVGERTALEEQLRRQAMQDPLTGLGNRALFRDRLEHAMARSQRQPELLAVLMVDLDGFKQVNDSLGHDAGDRLLAEVARRLLDCVRAGDTVARMGGDEFAVLLERADLEGPAVVAQRIVYRLRAPVDIDGKAIVTQGSVGVAVGSVADISAGELLRNADLAMYVAKSKGKGTYEIYQQEMHAAALERVELESELRDTLRQRELTLHYQPVVELATGRVSGAEALVRWWHPERGFISPAEFVPLAEESGLVIDLGRWVLGEACRQAREFQDAFPADPPFTIAVNVAARQLTSPWLVDEVRKALAESHLPATSLVLEITEGALMRDAAAIVPTLESLRAMGVRLAIDDFGTGWSSLSRLRSFPVDKLKIDQSFVAEITSSADDAPIVAAIVAMAHSLQLTTVAEGVETLEQLACLHQRGCEEVQGYLLSRPLPADQLMALLANPGGLLEPPDAEPAPLSRAEQGLMGLVAETALPGDGQDRIRPVLAELQRLTGADAVYLTEVDWAEKIQELGFSSGAGPVPEGVHLPWAGSPCERMLQGGPRLIEDLATAFPAHPLVHRAGVRTLATVPLCASDGHVFGTLCAAHCQPGGLGPGTVVLLELFARLLVEHVGGRAALAAPA
jgi:diguanylate cyclase (GGDEF)-like protein/PAS domain S-box-containing protein